MPASQGTPTIFEKLRALVDPAMPGRDAILAGEQRDLTSGEQAIAELFGPILAQAESAGQADLTLFLKAILSAVPNITSLAQASGIVNGALNAENGVLKAQATSIGQSMLTTFISAALTAVGKLHVPVIE